MRAFWVPPPLSPLEPDPEKSVFVSSGSMALGMWGSYLCVRGKLQQVCVHESGYRIVPVETVWSLEELC